MPVVSIVVPVFNSEKFLRQCLDSLVRQTFCDIEIICVNDGSTDSSPDILREYAQRDPRVIVLNKENGGNAAGARNMGAERASGKYVQFLDSDDFFELDMVKLAVESAEKNDSDLVIFGANYYDDVSGKSSGCTTIELGLAPDKEPFSYQDCAESIFQLGELFVWNKLFRRDFFCGHSLRFEDIPISDDQLPVALALVLAKRISVIQAPLVHYRINTGTSQVDRECKSPRSAYLATYSAAAGMRECGVYGAVKRSYLNQVIRLMRKFFDKMDSCRNMRFLYEIYRGEVFPALEAENLPEGYFYDSRVEDWYRMICTQPFEEILFQAARGYQAKMTTAILRFQAPFDSIEPESRVVLVGKGIVGRYWYAQMLLSGYCQVVDWVEAADQIPQTVRFDKIVYAK